MEQQIKKIGVTFFFFIGKLKKNFENSLFSSNAGGRVDNILKKKITLFAFTKPLLLKNIDICIASFGFFVEKRKRMKVPFWQNFAIFVNPKNF